MNEGKFWNTVKGGWDKFSKSSSGLVLIDSLTNYLSNKLGGNSFTQPGAGEPTPNPTKDTEPQPMSATTKYLLIGGGVLLLGFIIYSATKSK